MIESRLASDEVVVSRYDFRGNPCPFQLCLYKIGLGEG
jgi:hypothetical protein